MLGEYNVRRREEGAGRHNGLELHHVHTVARELTNGPLDARTVRC
jgi:hypothetical protein